MSYGFAGAGAGVAEFPKLNCTFGATSDPGNTAYIANLATNATSFSLTYGEFVYLGNNKNGGDCGNADCGITFDGVDGGGGVTGAGSLVSFLQETTPAPRATSIKNATVFFMACYNN